MEDGPDPCGCRGKVIPQSAFRQRVEFPRLGGALNAARLGTRKAGHRGHPLTPSSSAGGAKNLAQRASPGKRVLPHGKPRMGRQKILRCRMAASRGVANSIIAPRPAALALEEQVPRGVYPEQRRRAPDDGCACGGLLGSHSLRQRGTNHGPSLSHGSRGLTSLTVRLSLTVLSDSRMGRRAVGYDLSPLSGAVRRAWVCTIRRNAHGQKNAHDWLSGSYP